MTHKISKVVLIDSSADRYLRANGVFINPLTERISEILKDNAFDELRFDRPSWRTVFHKPNNKKYTMGSYILIWLIIQIFKGRFVKTERIFIFGIGINPVVNLLAKLTYITTIEISHGFCFYKLPWGWDKCSSLILPDNIIVFDRISMLAFENNKNNDGRPRAVLAQHPRYEPKSEKPNLNVSNRNVLIALQWGYDGDDKNYSGILKNGIIPDVILKIIDAKPETKFVIRLHPKMKIEEYADFVERVEEMFSRYPNSTIDYCETDNLKEAILDSKIVVSMYSTISFEAANLGRKSVVMCPSLLKGGINHGMFNFLQEKNVCQYIGMHDHKALSLAIDGDKNIPPVPLFTKFPKLDVVIKKLLK